MVRTNETGIDQTQEIKTFSAKNECNGVNFGVVTKFKFKYSIVRFFQLSFNQLTGLHQPLQNVTFFFGDCGDIIIICKFV